MIIIISVPFFQIKFLNSPIAHIFEKFFGFLEKIFFKAIFAAKLLQTSNLLFRRSASY